MRRLVVGAALAATALLHHPAAAFVQPPDGAVLPDYDVRKDASAIASPEHLAAAGGDAAQLGIGDGIGAIRPVVVEPTAAQLAAVKRLRLEVAPALRIEFREDNGLPRVLHAWGQPLSAPSTADAVEIARGFLRANADLYRLTPAEIDALIVARNARTGDVFRTVWLAQSIGGVLVDRAELRFAIDREGRVFWQASGSVQPGLTIDTTAALAAAQAVEAAARHIGRPIDGGLEPRTVLGTAQAVFRHPSFLGDVIVEPRIFPMWSGSALLAWQVMLEPQAEFPQWYVVTVDAASGKLLARSNLYKYANPTTNAGLVFANGEHPNTVPNPPFVTGVPQSQQGFGYNWPSTTGWTVPAPYGLYNFTVGNNVDAKEDWVRDNETTTGRRADGGAMQEWFFPWLDAFATSTQTTQAGRIADAQRDVDAAVTNLFYWNNYWHDYVHRLGFDEAYGNFQMDNYSRGGCGKDAVYADAMDGAAPTSGNPNLNNANFGTPAESLSCSGTIARPRMQMFLWYLGGGTVLRDGDVDNGIIIHEYHHGISIRLVGGPYVGCMGGTQSGSIGEGGGDFEAASLFNNPKTGSYAVNDPVYGIRNFPMDANPRTYADLCSLGGCEVHNDGEIHASMMWDIRQKVGQTVVEQLAIDAYKLVPCSPSFLDYRDAMLLADENRYGGAHVCPMWDAYVARGMGFDAKGSDSPYAVADFVFRHPKCSGYAHLRYNAHTSSDTAGGNGDGLYGAGETIDLNVELQNFDGVATATGVSATIATTTPGITLLNATRSYPNIAAGGAANPTLPFQFRIDPGYVCGQPIDFTVTMSWAPGLSRSDDFTDSRGSTPGIVLASSDAEGAPWAMSAPAAISTAQNHTAGGTQSYYMLGGCYAGDETSCTGAGPCNDTCPTITLPPISLPTNQAAEISFWAKYNLEYGWDGIYVEVSDDGGASWNYVPTLNYNGSIVGQNNGCNPGDYAAVTGPFTQTLSAWTQFQGDLAAYAGRSVLIRLRENHDTCVYFEGAFIDDIQLRARNCTSAPFVTHFISNKSNNDGANPTCTDNDSNPDAGETVDATITLTNSGNTTATNLQGTLTSSNPAITIVTGTGSFGTLAPGQSGSATFRYTVANPGPGCFEAADFNLALTANGGSYSENVPFTEVLRKDSGTAVWFDAFEGARPPWTPSLGPDGTAQDWALRELDCLSTGGNRWFWATNRGMVPTTCATGEPDYSADSDSVLTSPLIDLGGPGMLLTRAFWSTISPNIPTTVPAPGFVEILIDHDNDGNFTLLGHFDGGLGATDANVQYVIDIQNNPASNPIPPGQTAQQVRFQFRFRAPNADPGGTGDSIGMLVNDFNLEWQLCDVNACAPGLRGRSAGSVLTGGDGSLSRGGTGPTGSDPSGSSEP